MRILHRKPVPEMRLFLLPRSLFRGYELHSARLWNLQNCRKAGYAHCLLSFLLPDKPLLHPDRHRCRFFPQVCCNSDHRCCSTANTGNSRFSGCKLQSLTDHTLLQDQNPHMPDTGLHSRYCLNFRQQYGSGCPDCSCCAVRCFSIRYFQYPPLRSLLCLQGSGTLPETGCYFFRHRLLPQKQPLRIRIPDL